MIALWVVYAAAVAALAGAAAWAVERVLRAWGRPSRHVWAAALLGSVVLPLAVAVVPSAGPLPSVADAGVETSTIAPRGTPVEGPLEIGPDPALSSIVELIFPVAPRLAALDGALRTAWLVVSGTALLLLLLGLRAMARRRAGWTRRTVEGRPVLVAPDFGPAVVGVRHPEIVVPEWALRLERRLLRLVLLHEDQHRSAGDTLLLTVGVLAVAAAPWNLFLWWQLRRLRLAVEMDCDRRVLARGVSRVAYGRLLLEVGRRQPRSGLAVAALAEPKSFLERRIRMITTRGSNRSVLRAAVALAFAALLVVVACETPVPTALDDALDDAGMNVEDIVSSDGQGAYVFTADVLWVLDGEVIADPGPLASLDPDEIRSIEVVKGDATTGAVNDWIQERREDLERRYPDARRVILISTKEGYILGPAEEDDAGEEVGEEQVPEEGRLREVRFRARGITALSTLDPGVPPVFVVDGVITDLTPEEARALDIERVEVVRGEAARTAAGERGADGVILITTRGGGS